MVHLDLSRNELQVLPDLELPLLERLELSYNHLHKFPTHLFLPKLVHLDLSHNKIDTIPRMNPEHLPQLKHFNLSDNDLGDVTGMMPLCGSGCTLKYVALEGNESLRVPTPQIVERGGKAVRQFLMDLNQGRRKCWSQTIMVLGKEAAGKSALCRALLGERCPDHAQTEEMSTIGIDTVHWQAVVALHRPNGLVSSSDRPYLYAPLPRKARTLVTVYPMHHHWFVETSQVRVRAPVRWKECRMLAWSPKVYAASR